MIDADLLRSLGIDPTMLAPAAPASPRQEAAFARLRERVPCLLCGQPSSAVDVAEAPGHGRRWVDRCMPCMVATTPRGGPRGSLEDVLSVLRDAAHEAGVTAIRIVTDKE
ncbi:hypothetical protein [Streptomyces sp. OR43]|uniref:hypothetical protein n=1 Tax=Streptomyces sp. or43 TaxID=2478957 RepID=UPI0011CE2AC3|nr:hypothetical protein [Streptomyces sp. or43]TXS44940.1 hypothetical protein EAO72_07920 [Streptomyces sp. or43]